MSASLPFQRENERRRGAALVEFALVGSFIFLPILAGLATVGMSMVTAMQVANLNATAAQMFSTGVDFSQGSSQNLLLTMAGQLNTSSSAGGVVILSEIDGTGTGPVCSAPVQIPLGTGASGSGASQCAAISGSISLLAGQSVYLAETYYNNPLYTWAFAPSGTGNGIYVKAIF